MAVEKVTASISENESQLQNTERNVYSGSVIAPTDSGVYDLEISAYDNSGNITTINNSVEVSKWHTPKTDWKSTDRFNYEDYNRIKNNLLWLHEKAEELYKFFAIDDMGEDITDYTANYNFNYFNAWEKNLVKINENIFTKDYGNPQVFFGNGTFIKAEELTRIESAILNMRNILDVQEKGIKKLSFRLGTFKEVRI